MAFNDLNGFLEFENESWPLDLTLVVMDVVHVGHCSLPSLWSQLLDEVSLQCLRGLHGPVPRHDEVHGESHPHESRHLHSSPNKNLISKFILMSRFPCLFLSSSPSDLVVTLTSTTLNLQQETKDGLSLFTWNRDDQAWQLLLVSSNKMHLPQLSI